jgi:3-dehydroquinate synthase
MAALYRVAATAISRSKWRGGRGRLPRMRLIERTITVAYRHRVFFTEDVFGAHNPILRDVLAEADAPARPVLVTLDAGLAAAQPDLALNIEAHFATFPAIARLACPPVTIRGGEAAKSSLRHVATVQTLIERHGLCRHSHVIAVGGGAHLDVVGLAAATAHRGIRHVRIPTTTLSQADSGVGVKNGINAFGKKNFIGTFAPPAAVINDFAFLASLPPREQRAGFAEAVKVALIRDPGFFAEVERDAPALARFEPEAVRRLVIRCAELHVDHIATSGDPFEFGAVCPLDFGHWAAHKLEEMSGYALRHGEAVAIGLALDTIYSRRRGLLDAASCERVLELLARLGFALFTGELSQHDSHGRLRVLGGLDEFREHLGGELSVTLLTGIGRRIEVREMDAALVAEAIAELAWRTRPACGAPD